MKITVIGAGLGGLSAACLLATEGHKVTILEKNSRPGGKINRVKTRGYYFDTGPSLLTMPFILEELFQKCGARLSEYLTLQSLDTVCRYRYPDGTVFNCYRDRNQLLEEVRRIAPEDEKAFRSFLTYSSDLYQRTEETFLRNPLYSWKDLRSLNISDFFNIDAFTTVSSRIDSRFSSSYLRHFFKRFTTYNGSSPYRAPATLNVIPHVEIAMGGYYIKGGMYSLIEALVNLANTLGITILYDCEVRKINTREGSAKEVVTEGKAGVIKSDIILANSDATETYLQLLDERELSPIKRKRIRKLEPSCSGFVLLLGIDRRYEPLSHHNIFFSDDYEREFRQIFRKRVMPDEPTIYIANTSHTDPSHAPADGSNLFILVNAPYLNGKQEWDSLKTDYGNRLIARLENYGLESLSDSIAYRKEITPADFYRRYRSHRGSIYGTSSNSRLSAFMRPRNKSREVDSLYLTGGSTHPGGGIPLVVLSAFHAVELIGRYEQSQSG